MKEEKQKQEEEEEEEEEEERVRVSVGARVCQSICVYILSSSYLHTLPTKARWPCSSSTSTSTLAASA